MLSDIERKVFLEQAEIGKNKAKAEFYDNMPYAYIGYLEGLLKQAVEIIQNVEPASYKTGVK